MLDRIMIERDNPKGFTIVELMVALALTIIVTSVMYSLYKVQSQSTTVQSHVAEMQQNLRAASDILTREIRMAGFDPQGTNQYGIDTATATRFVYTADICENGGVPGGCAEVEQFTVELYNTDNNVVCNDPVHADFDVCSIRRTNGGAAVAENIERLEFCYFENNNANCSVNPGNVNDITAVRLSILIRSSREDSRYSHPVRADRSNIYVSGSGIDWTPTVADGFRRRVLVKTIKLRNMGL